MFHPRIHERSLRFRLSVSSKTGFVKIKFVRGGRTTPTYFPWFKAVHGSPSGALNFTNWLVTVVATLGHSVMHALLLERLVAPSPPNFPDGENDPRHSPRREWSSPFAVARHLTGKFGGNAPNRVSSCEKVIADLLRNAIGDVSPNFPDGENGSSPFAVARMILAVRRGEIFDGEIWGGRPQSRFFLRKCIVLK